MVFRLLCTILLTFVFLTACSDPLKTKEKVQEAIVERVKTHSGLDVSSMDITTTNVEFEKNKAIATVAFHPKGDTSINGGMTMKYNLEEQNGKWVVTPMSSGSGAPGGHPAVMPGSDGSSPLPAGHPALPEPAKP